jgi:uncharacterized protein DUF1874
MTALPLGLLNAPVLTGDGDGTYSLRTLSLREAQIIVAHAPLDSAIGHESTAAVMTDLLGREIPLNRQHWRQQVGQEALVFRLAQRAPEGVVLDRAGVEKVGYSFALLTREA